MNDTIKNQWQESEPQSEKHIKWGQFEVSTQDESPASLTIILSYMLFTTLLQFISLITSFNSISNHNLSMKGFDCINFRPKICMWLNNLP